jgi:TolB-like protein/Tfp pilus assembly protein PilF
MPNEPRLARTETHAAFRPPFADHPTSVVEAALERILKSATFLRSQRHRQFLQHVVRAMIDGRHEELKEIVIGIEVFGRPVDKYDPRRDPIVRVEAGRVRDKLARYYASEGLEDPFEIQIPIGGYLPHLSPRQESRKAARSLGSLAVLPFTSLSSHPDDIVFCDTLASQLIDTLSRVPGLRVVGRVSAFKAHAKGLDYKAIGKLLGVNTVIEGSLQRYGSRYRCIAQQFRTRDRVCLWSQRFEGGLDENIDIFALQDRISDAVLEAVTPRESPVVAPIAGHRTATNVEVRDLFERGRYLAHRYEIEDGRKAIALFERAVAIDPGFAPAYTQIASCQARLAMLMALPVATAFKEVESNATRALVLDPTDGEARGILANIASRVDHDWPRAERMFREALRAAPSSSRTHGAFGASLVYVGRYLEGLQHTRIALDLDPLNLAARGDHALSCSFARDFETAVREFNAVLEFEPDHFFSQVMLGMTQTWAGDHAAAIPHFERAAAIAPKHPVPGFCKALSLGAHGRVEEGRQYLEAHVARLVDVPYANYNRAMAEAYLEDRDAILASLRRAAAANENVMNSFAVDPSFDRYREDPEFVALREALRLPRVEPSPFLKPVPRV